MEWRVLACRRLGGVGEAGTDWQLCLEKHTRFWSWHLFRHFAAHTKGGGGREREMDLEPSQTSWDSDSF